MSDASLRKNDLCGKDPPTFQFLCCCYKYFYKDFILTFHSQELAALKELCVSLLLFRPYVSPLIRYVDLIIAVKNKPFYLYRLLILFEKQFGIF